MTAIGAKVLAVGNLGAHYRVIVRIGLPEVPAVPCPMDFSAWFEAYLGGHWHIFDARHNRRRIGRSLIARGR